MYFDDETSYAPDGVGGGTEKHVVFCAFDVHFAQIDDAGRERAAAASMRERTA